MDLSPEFIAKVNSLPESWNARREQPEWDRDFTGRADWNANFEGRTDKAVTWFREAVAFSEIILGGFEHKEDLQWLAAQCRFHIKLGKNQGDPEKW